MKDDGQNIVFRNDVVSFDDPSDVITRRYDVVVEFVCKYPKTGGSATVQFGIHRPALTFEERGFGTFTYQFEFFRSPNFLQLIDPNAYPLEYNLGDMIYMQIDSVTSVPNTELFIESCIAAPTSQPNHAMSYTLIQNG